MVENLLDAGADLKFVSYTCHLGPPNHITDSSLFSIKDKNGDRPLDLVPLADTTTRALIRKAQAKASMGDDMIDDEDDDGMFHPFILNICA